MSHGHLKQDLSRLMCFIYRICEGIVASSNHADEKYHLARMSDQLNIIVEAIERVV